MNSKRRQFSPWILGVVLGLLLLCIVYATVSEIFYEISLRRLAKQSQIRLEEYSQSFRQVQHPQGTFLVDPIAMDFEYRPFRKIDEMDKPYKWFYMVGELRSYTGNWNDVEKFYAGQLLVDNQTILVMVIPLEFREGRLQLMNGYNPRYWYESDFVLDLSLHYDKEGIPKGLNEMRQHLYLVYGMWPNEDRPKPPGSPGKG